MKKTVLVIVCVLLLSAVVLCINILPDCFKTIDPDAGSIQKINADMQAIKLDKNGNVTGTVQITLQGDLTDFQNKEDIFHLSVSSFDHLNGINFIDTGETSVSLGTIGDEFYSITGTAWDTSKNDMIFVTAKMSLDFEYWVFCAADNENPIYYIASASNTHTAEEIVQHFKGLAPGYKAP